MRKKPYLSLTEYRRADLGGDSDQIPDEQVQEHLEIASAIIDEHTGNAFHWRRIKRERHRWRGDYFTCTLYNKPIRVITDLRILTGASGGKSSGVTIYTTPVTANVDPTDLPSEFGDVSLNRAVGKIQATSLLLTTGTVPLVAFSQPWVEVTYTAGYDEGDEGDPDADPPVSPTVVAPDGYVLPYPWWLTKACRLVTADLLSDYWNRQRGMGKLLQIQIGGTNYRRAPVRAHIDYSIPVEAQQLLQLHETVWLA